MQARSEFDQGAVDLSFKMSYMTLLTVPSADQKRALNKLLADQQNPHSASYHKWLTPEQYADRFGLSANDLKNLVDWLQSQGFTIVRTARARNWIAFSGTVDQVERTFQTQIHNYKVDGEMHFANTVPPAIPAVLTGVVSGIRGLNNFRLRSQAHRAKPGYTLPFQGNNFLFVAPGDIAAIYDINTLYQAGIDGSGETLAIIGQTGIFQSDLNDFRTGFGLSPINCTVASDIITACNTPNFRYVLVNGSPTNIFGDISEADIDIEWSGATARKAQIVFVTATDPNGAGVVDSLYYAVDNKVSPVMSMSYTAPCELAEAEFGSFDADEAELQKANSFGITFMNSSGDTGAAECDFGSNLAIRGYAAAYPASSQYVTGVGGTSIPAISPNEYTATFWNPTNGSDGGSAKGYIPEQAWNDAQEFGLICSQASPPPFCAGNGITNWATAQTVIGISAGGGGVSNCVTVDQNFVCQSGFPQPSWQQSLVIPGTIPGETTAPARFTPDVSLLGSPNFPGYIVCTQVNGSSGGGSSCANGIASMLNACLAGTGPCTIFGGTSVSSPVFAGIVTLLNQDVVANGVQLTPGLGNINPTLYALAATPANGAFNPVTTSSSGAYSNGAWCQPGTPSGVGGDPWPTNLVCPNSGFLGFSAFNFDPTTKYNLVTGLGSVNASHLAAAWVAQGAATSTTLGSSANPAAFGSPVTFTADVTTTGSFTPTGTVTFKDGATTLGTGNLIPGPGIVVTAHATFSTSALSSGSHSITAVYAGDTNNAGSTSAVLTQVITAPTFTLSTPSTPATVLSGQSTTSTFMVTATGSGVTTFAGDVTFACSGLPDATVTCSAPTITAGTASPVTETLTITTTGPNSNAGAKTQEHRRSDNRLPWVPLAFPLAGIVMVGFAGRKLSKYSVLAGLCVTLALLGFLVACGGSSSHPIGVSVSGSSSSIFPQNVGWTNETATFTATLTNDSSNKGVTWAVSTANGGTIQSTDATHATYTPPTIAAGLPTSVSITATSVADTSKTGTGSIRLNPTTVPGTYNITVTATESTTQHSQPVQFTVN
ncbi:MAG: protease pro-enzyme activation domain-containing protein [Terriglobales bacterium]